MVIEISIEILKSVAKTEDFEMLSAILLGCGPLVRGHHIYKDV